MPSNTTSSMFFYTYALESFEDGEEYKGCLNEQDAKRRERYLKATQRRRFLGLRLQEYKRTQAAFGTGS